MSKVIGLTCGALVLLFMVAGFLLTQALNSSLSGDDVFNMVFKREPLNFGVGDVRGSGSSVFQEGIVFARARFRSERQPEFREISQWHVLTSKTERKEALESLHAVFPEDDPSLQDVPAVTVFKDDSDLSFIFAYNNQTKIGAVSCGSEGSNFKSVIKRLNALNKYGPELVVPPVVAPKTK